MMEDMFEAVESDTNDLSHRQQKELKKLSTILENIEKLLEPVDTMTIKELSKQSKVEVSKIMSLLRERKIISWAKIDILNIGERLASIHSKVPITIYSISEKLGITLSELQVYYFLYPEKFSHLTIKTKGKENFNTEKDKKNYIKSASKYFSQIPDEHKITVYNLLVDMFLLYCSGFNTRESDYNRVFLDKIYLMLPK